MRRVTDAPSVIRHDERRVASGLPAGSSGMEAIHDPGAWIGFLELEPGAASGWHHHGNWTSYAMVQAGILRWEFGRHGADGARRDAERQRATRLAHRDLRPHVRYAASASKKLARGLFHAMARFGPKLDREQLLLSRFVGAATELFAISATCSYAQWLLNQGKPADEILSIASYFCRSARMRIDHHFAGTARNADKRGYDLVQDLLAGKHELLRQGMV